VRTAKQRTLRKRWQGGEASKSPRAKKGKMQFLEVSAKEFRKVIKVHVIEKPRIVVKNEEGKSGRDSPETAGT